MMLARDEHDTWMIEHFPMLYRRGENGAWQVNRYGTILTPVWHEATTNESRALDERERMQR